MRTPPIPTSAITLLRSDRRATFVPAPLLREIETVLAGATVVRLPHDFPHLSCPVLLSRHVEEHLQRCAERGPPS